MLSIDPIALLIVLCFFVGVFFFYKDVFKDAPLPRFKFSNVAFLSKGGHLLKEKLLPLPLFCFVLGLFFLVLAFLNLEVPVGTEGRRIPPESGDVIALILDRSGSMGQHKRFDLLKKAAVSFIDDFSGDLISVVSFARRASILSPPTTDYALLKRKIEELKVVEDKSEDGTAMGYAIYKTAHLLSELLEREKELPYTIQKKMMILISDGLHDPNLLDLKHPYRAIPLIEAARFAKEKGVRLYIVNIDRHIGEEAYEANRNELKRVTEMTGGAFILEGNLDNLQEVIKAIPNEGKKSFAKSTFEATKYLSLASPLMLAGLLLIASSLLLEALFFRRAF